MNAVSLALSRSHRQPEGILRSLPRPKCRCDAEMVECRQVAKYVRGSLAAAVLPTAGCPPTAAGPGGELCIARHTKCVARRASASRRVTQGQLGTSLRWRMCDE